MQKFNNTIRKISIAHEKALTAHKLMKEASDALSNGPSTYYFDNIMGYVRGLFERFAPLRPDDIGVVANDRIINEIDLRDDHGWKSDRQTFLPGRAALIKDVDFDSKLQRFRYTVEPFRQTWISSFDGKENPVDNNSIYTVWEGDYVKVEGCNKNFSYSDFELLQDGILMSGGHVYVDVPMTTPFEDDHFFFVDSKGFLRKAKSV